MSESSAAGRRLVLKVEECICGHCVWHRKHPNGDWYCNNENSENYILETAYDDGCDDFEER